MQNEKYNLVFLHGFAMQADVWSDFVKPLKKNHHVHCLDLYSCLLTEDARLEACADYVWAYIAKKELKNVVLVGHSMGGYVALELLKKEKKIAGLVLLHSHAQEDSPNKIVLRKKTIQFIQKHGKELFYKNFFPGLFGDKVKHKEVINRVIHNSKAIPQERILVSIYAMMNRSNNEYLLKELPFPVCWVGGQKDQLVNESMWMKTALSTKSAVIHILPKIGHMGLFEAPRKCRKIIENYIDVLKKT